MNKEPLILLIAVFVSMLAAKASEPPSLTLLQKQMLVYAYQTGGYPLASVIYQESSGCANLHGKNPHVLGCGQILLSTARYITGEPISAWMLEHDWQTNITVAWWTLRDCIKLFGLPGGYTCYTAGTPKASSMTKYQRDHSVYVHEIQHRLKELKSLPVDTK